MLGINRTDLNKTGTTAKDGSPLTLPHNVGNPVAWTPSPSHFGNPITLPLNVGNVVDWTVDPAHYGNKFASSVVDLPQYIGGASAHAPYGVIAVAPIVVTVPYSSQGGTTLLLKYYVSNTGLYYPLSVVDSNGIQWDTIQLSEPSQSADAGGVFGLLNSAPITHVTVTWGAPPQPNVLTDFWTYMVRVEEFSNVASIGEIAVNNGSNIGTVNPNPVSFPQFTAGNILTGLWLSGTSGIAPSAVAGTILDFTFAAPLLTIASAHGTSSPIAVNQNVSDYWLGLGVDLIAFGNPIPPIPTVMTPNEGDAAGGTFVTINGRGFLTGATVDFSDDSTMAVAPATNVVVLNDNTLTCNAPAGTSGDVASIIVTNPNGKTGLGDGFWDWA